MARFCTMFSGSSGNCTYVGTSDGGILIDAGVSASRIKKALLQRDIELESIKGIFITHEHSDHVSGIRVLASAAKIPVFMTGGTLDAVRQNGFYSDTVNYQVLGSENICANMKITYFATSHDCVESCGYIIDTGERKIAVCTDLGIITDEVKNAISGCDLVMLESNHDIMMLQNNSAYPYPLKRRILSDKGHLSNASCASEISRLVAMGSTRFVLAHLSRDNNMPSLALETARASLYTKGMTEQIDYLISVAPPMDGKMITL